MRESQWGGWPVTCEQFLLFPLSPLHDILGHSCLAGSPAEPLNLPTEGVARHSYMISRHFALSHRLSHIVFKLLITWWDTFQNKSGENYTA